VFQADDRAVFLVESLCDGHYLVDSLHQDAYRRQGVFPHQVVSRHRDAYHHRAVFPHRVVALLPGVVLPQASHRVVLRSREPVPTSDACHLGLADAVRWVARRVL